MPINDILTRALRSGMYLCLCFLMSIPCVSGQGFFDGTISGNLEARVNVFLRDVEIEAFNTPQYDNEIVGNEAWLNLVYNTSKFDAGVRFDMFTNSNLLNPNASFTDQGIGRWYVHTKIDKLDVTGGYIYDQIGVGTIFRAYEERPLLIDNALYGVRLAYDLGDEWRIKAFAGRQKQQFELYDAVLKGGSIEGFIKPKEDKSFSLAPGVGFVNRTYSDELIQELVNEVRTYTDADRSQVELKYNSYAYSLFNTLVAGKFSWYVEGALKSNTTVFDPMEFRDSGTGELIEGQLVNGDGSVIYTSFGYAAGGFGITLEAKRTEFFRFRTDPRIVDNQGQINFLPPMMRQNTYRLTARYAPATQDLGEIAFQADMRWAPSKKWNITANFSNIEDLNNNLLYREAYLEALYKPADKPWQLTAGIQRQEYNQDVYENKPGVPIVETITPFAEFLYKLSRRNSIRVEAQYMDTDEDFGSWAFLLAEIGFAPKWIITISDMYNTQPTKGRRKLHYPTLGLVYSKRANRFSLYYVKQVEGIVCTGGICRLEPAFSGFRFNMTTNF